MNSENGLAELSEGKADRSDFWGFRGSNALAELCESKADKADSLGIMGLTSRREKVREECGGVASMMRSGSISSRTPESFIALCK